MTLLDNTMNGLPLRAKHRMDCYRQLGLLAKMIAELNQINGSLARQLESLDRMQVAESSDSQRSRTRTVSCSIPIEPQNIPAE